MTAITPFKVIPDHPFGTSRKPVCDISNTNLGATSYLVPFPKYGGLLVKSSLSTGVPLFNPLVRGEPLNS